MGPLSDYSVSISSFFSSFASSLTSSTTSFYSSYSSDSDVTSVESPFFGIRAPLVFLTFTDSFGITDNGSSCFSHIVFFSFLFECVYSIGPLRVYPFRVLSCSFVLQRCGSSSALVRVYFGCNIVVRCVFLGEGGFLGFSLFSYAYIFPFSIMSLVRSGRENVGS